MRHWEVFVSHSRTEKDGNRMPMGGKTREISLKYARNNLRISGIFTTFASITTKVKMT